MPLLTLSWGVPLAGAILLLLIGNAGGRRDSLFRWLALGISLVEFALTVAIWAAFDAGSAEFQFVERVPWIPAFGIDYFVGIDGISLLLVVLTGFLTPIALMSSWEGVEKNVKEFSIFILALEAAMIGVFVSLDLFLFYVFWDAMLIPMYFLIGIWGYDQRIYAAVKFMLYTMAGSVLMLIAILGLAYLHSEATGSYSFDLLKLYALEIAPQTQQWFFLAFAVAFAIKVPLFPFHTWLPDAHVQAPTAGSIILAGVLLKMGTYGLVRFAFPLFPLAAVTFAPWIAVLAVIGIIYGALVAMVQPDMKKLVAYSSVSHLGFVVLGICAMNIAGRAGRGLPDAGARRQHRRALPSGRHAVGSAPHAPDRRVRRAAQRDAPADRHVPHHHAGVDRHARAQRVHRRVPDDDGRVSVGSPYGGGGGPRGDPLGRVHAGALPEGVPGRRHERQERVAARSQPREWASVAPLCAIAIVMGVFPSFFLRPMEPSVRKVVERVQAVRPVRVELPKPGRVDRATGRTEPPRC